ncbi:MAG: YvcK family protein, partial [Propionibacteriales bacterium]|nr:YvcK family protein [Propionibacteriales bacterium]
GDVVSVRLEPADPPACPEAIEAIDAAEWVVIGPGSWFTSVIPNLLVPGIRTALHRTSARRILVLNLGEQVGETAGFSPADHLDVIAAHAPELGIDYVLADTSALDAEGNLEAAAKALGAELVTAKVASAPGAKTHDSVRLTAALRQIIESA